jgi:trehalose 6-phosphate phosphatase
VYRRFDMPGDEVTGLLQPFWADAERAGVFTDFDGTLAPIVDDPGAAEPEPRASEVLGRLAQRFARVGVVSGRPLAFLESHLAGLGLVLSGLYGLETLVDGELVPDEEAERWRPAVEEVAADGERQLPQEVLVERKGLSVAVHFRTAPHMVDTARRWAEEQASRSGLALSPGRMSFELRPPVERSKGTSIAAMAEGLRVACFVGDDTGDLSGFDALDRIQAAGGHTLRVGVDSDEAPRELLERADLVVDGPSEVVDLFDRLATGP